MSHWSHVMFLNYNKTLRKGVLSFYSVDHSSPTAATYASSYDLPKKNSKEQLQSKDDFY